MSDEKDRFGDKLRDVEKAREHEYFAKRDRALIDKLKTEAVPDQEQSAKELAHLRCPKCGAHLHAIRHLGIALDECPDCKGIWVERGELEQLAGRESQGWLSRYLGRNR